MSREPVAQRFACTQCGKCCNRTPEVELSEAAALADVFVFRLMFRLYWLPLNLRDYIAAGHSNANASAVYYERKRLLAAFAARKYPAKSTRDGKPVQLVKYLLISALAVDTSPGACSALTEQRCGIYDRRPLSCRSVPLHYARPVAMAAADLSAFVETPGYECDTSEAAPVVLNDGQIVSPEIKKARFDSIAVAERDHRWAQAISSRMNKDGSAGAFLPSMQEIEANAHLGAITTSMRLAWQIASDISLISGEECDRLVGLQLEAIDRELAYSRCSPATRETLAEMQAEYRHHLSGDRVLVDADL